MAHEPKVQVEATFTCVHCSSSITAQTTALMYAAPSGRAEGLGVLLALVPEDQAKAADIDGET